MDTNENDEVFTDDVEDTSESVEETTEETQVERQEKPKRTPQEEFEYHMGRAKRIAKKLGLEESSEKTDVKKDSSKPTDDLDYGEKAYLRSALNIKGADEIQLAREWKKKYGSSVEEMESDEVFNARLTKLRETRESQDALPKGKNRSAQTAVTDIDMAVSKFKESGELPTDFKTRNAVIDRISAEENGPSFNFK
jgi:hypothetical protein